MLDLKSNFKAGKKDFRCRVCMKEEETQKHILESPKLEQNAVINQSDKPEYEHLFSTDSKKVEVIGRILISKYRLVTNNHSAQPGNQAGAARYVPAELRPI